MERRLLLTGPSGCGKSSMIWEALGPHLAEAGGFLTRLSAGEDGSLLGLELLPAAAAGGIEGFEPRRVLDFSRTPPKAETEAYRETGVQLLEDAAWYPFALLDEFGGFELIVPQFREALKRLLASDVPCIGVFKDAQEAELLRTWLGLGEKLSGFYTELRAWLEADPDTLLLPVEEPGDEAARQAVARWAAEYAR